VTLKINNQQREWTRGQNIFWPAKIIIVGPIMEGEDGKVNCICVAFAAAPCNGSRGGEGE
jgi:hypothetical protein